MQALRYTDFVQTRNNRLVASYPVPPTTYFQSPPRSVCSVATASGSSTRHTYAATSSLPSATETPQRPRVLHFAEQLNQPSGTPILHNAYDLPTNDGRVFDLAVLPHVGGESSGFGHDIVVVHENGTLACLNSDLQTERWHRPSSSVLHRRSAAEVQSVVEFSELIGIEQASKGLLSGRQDVLAQLGVVSGLGEGTLSSSMILVLLEKRTGASSREVDRSLHILAVQRHSADGISSRSAPVQHLVDWILPSTQSVQHTASEDIAQYSLNASMGILHQLVQGHLTTFDFHGLLPQVTSAVESFSSPFGSFLSVSPTTILTTSDSEVTMYDAKYNTVQARQSLALDEALSNGSRKRKRLSNASLTSLKLLTILPSSGLVVGIHGVDVIGLRLGVGLKSSRRKTAASTLLVHALGKGARLRGETSSMCVPYKTRELPKFLRSDGRGLGSSLSLNWARQQFALKEAADAADVSRFERAFALTVGVNLPENPAGNALTNGLVNGNHSDIITNGTHPDEAVVTSQQDALSTAYTWPADQLVAPLPHSVRQQALFALGCIFEQTGDLSEDAQVASRRTRASALNIKFCPPNVFRWLVVNNFVTVEMINQALLRQKAASEDLGKVSPDELATALAAADPSTHLLFTLVTESTYLDLGLLIRAIKLYVQSHEGHSSARPHRGLITASPSRPNDDGMDLDFEPADFDTLLSRADEDISRAESILDESFELRTIGLKHALIKLYAFPRLNVTQMLRKELSAHEIRFLIHILRIELQDGGWVSRYLDAGPTNLRAVEGTSADFVEPSAHRPSDSAIAVVSSLLSSCVDAIGIGGWLTGSTFPSGRASLSPGSPDDLDPHELLHIMYNETFAVLEGLHEVNFINSAVMDFLHFADRLRLSGDQPNIHRQNKKARAAGEPTKPEPAYTGDAAPESIEARLQAAIPVGSKVAEVDRRIETVKISLSGQAKAKSKREIGQEKSRKVGLYSFEKIRL